MILYDIFVSHAARPSPFVRDFIVELVAHLRRKRLIVFLDLDSMGSEVRILPALDEAIEHSLSGIYIVTERSESSGWVTIEQVRFRERQLTGQFPVCGLRFDESCGFSATLTWERKFDIDKTSIPQQIGDDIVTSVLPIISR
jgi:hypothetical protein